MASPTTEFRVSRWLRRAGAGAVLLWSAAGCGGDGGTGPNEDVAGRYEIVRVNDDVTPPFTLAEGTDEFGSYAVQLVSGSFTLDADGTYVLRLTARFLENGRPLGGDEVVPPQLGRYRVSGDAVVFDPEGNDPDEPDFEADRDGDTLTLTQSDEDPDTGLPITVTIVAQR
jgi:hypothetical protein